jgi:hypothetical protein
LTDHREKSFVKILMGKYVVPPEIRDKSHC